MPEQLKNMMIGIFITITMGLVVAMVLFIKPTVGDGKQVLHVRFSNINGISVGTRVIFAGRAIGEVENIEVIPDARNMPVDANGNLYYYVLTLKIDSKISIFTTDVFTVQTSGLLGDKSVAIIPKAPNKDQKPKLINSQSIIYAESSDLLESAYNMLSKMADTVSETFDEATLWLKKNGNQLGDAIENFDELMKHTNILVLKV